MAELAEETRGESTVLDLATRLGVRSQVVMDTLSSLGLEVDDPTAPLDPQVEERLVDQMVESGQVASRARKKAKKRRSSQQPLADDMILQEALGASESGFSRGSVPQEVAHMMPEEKPSFLERLGLRKPRQREEPDTFRGALEPEGEKEDYSAAVATEPPPEREPIFQPSPPPSQEPESFLDDEEDDLGLNLEDVSAGMEDLDLTEDEEPAEEPQPEPAPKRGSQSAAKTEPVPDQEQEEADLGEDFDLDALDLDEEESSDAGTEEDLGEDVDLDSLDLGEEEEAETEKEGETEAESAAQETAADSEKDIGEDIDLEGIDLGEEEQGEGGEEEQAEPEAEPSGEGEADLGEDLDLEGLDLGDGDDSELQDLLGDGSEEDILQGLEDLDLGDFGEEEEEETPAEEEAEAEAEEGEEDEEEGEEDEEEEDEDEEEEDEEEEPGFLERIILKLNLSPIEMIAAATGSLLVMVTALGLTVYYYMNYSPRKAADLWETGYRAYQSEVLGDRNLNTIVDSFTRLLVDFPEDPHLEEAAYLLARAHYRRAEEVAKEKPDAAKSYYAETVDYFYKFLEEQRRIGDRLAQKQGEGYRRYMRTDYQEDAYYYIALAYEKQDEYEQALEAYENYLEHYPNSDRAPQIRVTLGDIYRKWAGVDENARTERLLQAIEQYESALEHPSIKEKQRVALHNAMGDIYRLLYDTTKEEYRRGFLDRTLKQYRTSEKLLAQREHEDAEEENLEQTKLEQNLAEGLADTLLVLGTNSANLVEQITRSVSAFQRSDPLRKRQLAEAENQRATAEKRLSEAAILYSRLLGLEPDASLITQSPTVEILASESTEQEGGILTTDEEDRIKKNLADAYFQMGKYNKAMDVAIPLIQELEERDPDSEYLAPLCYLVGDAAWEVGDYERRVVDYYRKGREQNPLYPPGSGERSHKAALRMANTYFSRGLSRGDVGQLESAISEYNRILREFPETDWTYFTRYWLAKTYEKHADVLSTPNTEHYDPEAARENYQYAYNQYQLALEARDRSGLVDKDDRDAQKDCYFRSGQCAYKANDLGRAREMLSEAILWSATGAPGDPRAIPCRELLGDIYLELGHPDHAIRIYEHYLDQKYHQLDERGDSLSRVSLKLAKSYLRRFSYGQARKVLERVVRDNPVERKPGTGEVVEGPKLKAQRLLAQSYRDEADVSFDDARREALLAADQEYVDLLEINPKEYSALRAIAEINFELANPQSSDYYDRAAEFFRRYVESGAVDADEDRDEVLYRWGDSYYHLGEYEKAADALKRIHGTTISNAMYGRALLLLGDCYERIAAQQTGDFEKKHYLNEAQQAYQNVTQTQDPFATQAARNRMNMMNLP